MGNEQEIRDRLAQYRWYHTIELTDAIATPGWGAINSLVAMSLEVVRSINLRDKRVLDIGCRDGLFSFEAEKMGAGEVIGIDCDLSAGATEFLIPYFRSRIRLRELNLLDLRPDTFGLFDVVIFPGVLYHLRYPVWSLKLARDVLKEGGTLFLETAVIRDDNYYPMLYCPVGAESPYEPSSCTFFNRKGLADTLFSLGLHVQRTESLAARLRGASGGVGRKPPAPGLLRWAGKRLLHAALGQTDTKPPIVGPKESLRSRLDRVAVVCQYCPALIDPVVDRYWNGTHKIHSRAIWE
jgi:SAM-dependent methyltransferase